MPARSSRVVLTAVLTAATALVLAACTATDAPNPSPTSSSTQTGAPAPAPTTAATFVPGGSATDNLPFFDAVNSGVVAAATAANQTPDGAGFVTALRNGGFAVADMQLTPDITTVGVKADSVQFSVALGGQCLIGQYGFGEYHSLVAPLLGTGKCLIGETRTIDF
ncbi:hypothetical protein B7R54_05725 [Subtercola boreus]|uniref:DUF6993 domain-containing protein n=1 Tax=Subtercola boreus TaxID=120213 RepID=A0A3E0VHC6_9MICO|nr:hypothetical protein [Subtercola boreus]RFA08780.1 hypothetical protein B7R54_05725 [Subtercola boreus]TQL54257.1 hypothetical protein FB464_1790 [Subtercola boreus]